MTRELIINGQRVDLSGATSVTLEYVSNVLTGGSGKINLSKSYTIKVPKTLNNARILDDPGAPAHASSMVRRFLPARYYQNGIDMLGAAQAYVLKSSAESYDLALIWNSLPQLQALSESDATLNDVEGLPVLTWIGANGHTPDYGAEQDGAFFAHYDAGLGGESYPDVPTATHPAMGALPLIDKILTNAGVPYEVSSERVRSALSSMCILAAPSHRPNSAMDQASGSSCTNVRVGNSATGGTFLAFDVSRAGWDAPVTGSSVPGTVTVGGVKTFHISLRLRTSASLPESTGAAVLVLGSDRAELARVDFVRNADGAWDAVAELDLSVPEWSGLKLSSQGVPVGTTFTTSASGYFPLEMWRVRDAIDIEHDNRFPIAENLPALKQWEFVKACLVLAGAVPVIQNGTLLLMGYDEAFDKADAYDWSSAVTEETSVAPRLSDWARENIIVYTEDDKQRLTEDPSAVLIVQDETLKQSRELYKLPFAASQLSSVQHYTRNDEGELEDVAIKPRILARRGNDLVFAPSLSGEGLIRANYGELQRVITSPVVLELSVRLHELDLASLDLRRPVYLRQYGKYYSIIKVQASNGDACKVELIQIP